MVQAVSQHKQMSGGQGVMQSVTLGTCKWPRALVTGEGRPLKYAAVLKGSKALMKSSVLLKAAQENPFQ